MTTDKIDVLIIGAGLSGIGAACRLRRECPDKRVVILEARAAMGGTWDLFRYPGIRCDTDMYTLGYGFAPFPGEQSIADGEAICQYIRDTAAEYKVDRLVRYDHKVVRTEWSSQRQTWLVTAEVGGEQRVFECVFLHCCSGYYRYDRGYQPDFPGQEQFGGRLIHPQHWPKGLDYTSKKVVIIGSGATAVTLVPAMAERAAHVTMLQRSPSYVLALPRVDPLAAKLERLMPKKWAYYLTRWKNMALAMFIYRLARTKPEKVRSLLRHEVIKVLGPDYPVDEHFKPSYQPFDQRICFMPDGDLLQVLKSGKADIVTDRIETFTSNGIRLQSGRQLDADIVVTATGLELLPMAGLVPIVDGVAKPVSEALVYKGMMLSDVPNYAFTVGYTSVPWTLKADMVSQYVCRLINYMDQKGYRQCAPRPASDVKPVVDLMDITSGYAQRAAAHLPKQGESTPWRLTQNYLRDRIKLFNGRLRDGVMEFS